MKRKPRASTDGIFSGGLGIDVIYQGVTVAVLTLFAYFTGIFMETGTWSVMQSNEGITMAFLTMSMAEIFHSFNMRSQRESIFSLKSQNFFLLGAMALALILTTSVIYIAPVAEMFRFSTISFKEYLAALGTAFLIIPIVEIVKLIQRIRDKNKD